MADRRRAYQARWVMPMVGAPVDGGVVVLDGRNIEYVGPRAEAPSVPLTDLGDAVLLPGLVNVHTHLELTAMRHALEGLAFVPWIRALTAMRDSVLADPSDQVASAQLGIAEGLLRGITTMADTATHGASVLSAMQHVGVRGVVFQEVFGPDPAAVDASMEMLRARVNALRATADDLRHIGISPHAPYSVSAALYSRVAEFARADALPVAVHLAESADESALVTAGDGVFARAWRSRGIDPATSHARSPVALLARCGVLSTQPLVIHGVRLDAEDLAMLAEHQCAMAHCPVSNARFGHGIASVHAWRAAGLCIGIGTDSVASNNQQDLLSEARTAHLMASAREQNGQVLSATDLLQMCTVGGARALRRWDGLGTLVPGAPADVIALPLDGLGAFPLHDLSDAIVHGMAATPARLTIVAGRPLVVDGALHDAPWWPDARARVGRLGAGFGAWRAAHP
jgi:cytosine/adenosine deaminase-related metal-dependent hydrolase